MALAIIAISAAMLASALALEYTQFLAPCPLCMIQRWGLAPVAAGCLLTLLQPHRLWGALLVFCGVLAGGITAIRQLFLQWLGPELAPACGPPLEYLVSSGAGLQTILDYFWAGNVSCATVQWSLLGLSIPGWSLLGYTMILAVVSVMLVRGVLEGRSP